MTSNRNIKTFGQQSAGYASARPQYPEALFDWISSQCSHHTLAWDCATGNGQAAQSLAKRFDTVQATDLSAEQIKHCIPASNISYRACPAEATPFDNRTFDLITVAQALHWFDFKRFWDEVRRVAKPGAFFCAWGYGLFEGDAALDNTLGDWVKARLDCFWAEGNRIIMRGYPSEDIKFPFERISAPDFKIEVSWSIEQVISFVETWSAYKIAIENSVLAKELDYRFREARHLFAGQTFDLVMPIDVVAARIE